MSTTKTRPPALSLRLQVRSVATGIIKQDTPGILCIGVPAFEGSPALVLIKDEQDLNQGASATNACDRVLTYLRAHWGDRLRVQEANLVECDSEGMYDKLHADWTAGAIPRMGWSPLRDDSVEPRTEAAFLKIYGTQAAQALEAVNHVYNEGTQ